MIKNYIKTAWRSLLRNKSYAAINILGLAIGIAACLLIFLVVTFETSFDNFHKNKDHIYRIVSTVPAENGGGFLSGVPVPVTAALPLEYPKLKGEATIFQDGGSHFTIGDNSRDVKKFKEDLTFFIEPRFFDIFNFAWLAGDKKTALNEPNTVVLTQDEAEKFFGDWHNAIGKIIKLENNTNLKVTGILKNMPANTDFPLKVIISYATDKLNQGGFTQEHLTDWVSISGQYNCFVVLPPNLSVATFNNDLAAMVKKHKPAQYTNQGMVLQSLNDMHYDTKIGTFNPVVYSKQLIKIISLIGLFLLVIACVNFINLATAQAVNRSKEVGIRKVLGSRRKQLVIQFITETFFVTICALVLAIGIAYISLPFLNDLLNIQLSRALLYQPVAIAFIAGILVGVTLLAGFYPAMVLSGFNPITAIKNRIASNRSSGVSLRRGLVVFQFCIAQILVIGTLVIISQMDYFKNHSLGFVKDAVINVPIPTDSVSQTKTEALRNQLLQQPGISDVSYSFASPSDRIGWGADFNFNNSPKKTDFEANLKWADNEYFKLYKLQFIAGHAYGKTDTTHGYVVNEILVKKLGLSDPKDAIGKNITMFDDKNSTGPIVGVVKDYNVSSLKKDIPPVLMASNKSLYRIANIKIQPVNVQQTLASIERLWSNAYPDNLYEYQFLDDKIAGFYKSETQLSALYKLFAGIAIFISCLGLYGLISFMAVQRTKEVGIRKTLGASVTNIVYLFSKEFTILIAVAFVISAPLGWYFMNKWLQNFTYRIPIGPGIFILAIASSIVIAWITVGYKAIGAALANPVKSLRSE